MHSQQDPKSTQDHQSEKEDEDEDEDEDLRDGFTEDGTSERDLSLHSLETGSSPVSPEFQPLYELCIYFLFWLV